MRALTPSSLMGSAFLTLCRNDRSPYEGIDTISHKYRKLLTYGRNDRSPYEGIDTIAIYLNFNNVFK